MPRWAEMSASSVVPPPNGRRVDWRGLSGFYDWRDAQSRWATILLRACPRAHRKEPRARAMMMKRWKRTRRVLKTEKRLKKKEDRKDGEDFSTHSSTLQSKKKVKREGGVCGKKGRHQEKKGRDWRTSGLSA